MVPVSVGGKQLKAATILTKAQKSCGRTSAPDATRRPQVFQKKDGTLGSSYEVFADTVRFLSSRGETGQDRQRHGR